MIYLSGIFVVLGLTLIPDVYSDVPRTGLDDLTKIIGGQETTIEKYPFIVFIETKFGNSGMLCCGTLVKEDWVLTAAHCLVRIHNENSFSMYATVIKAKGFRIIAGLALIDVIKPAAPVNERRVIRTYPNKYYNYRATTDDIGLIKLKRGFETGSSTIQIVRLPTSSSTYNDLDPESCMVAGWGMTSRTGDDEKSATPESWEIPLKDVELEIVKHDKCQEKHGGYWWGKPIDSESQICTEADVNADAFFGDSGGPLVIDGYQMGIVSFGDGDMKKKSNIKPTLFTRIDFYLDWINGTISTTTTLRPQPWWSILSCSAYGSTIVIVRLWL